jgi:general secretion pathway protein G
MKSLYRHMHRDEKGFTLVELMIVIIILAILTAIAVPSYMVLRNRARVAAAQSEMKNIATAFEMYNADWDQYPPAETWVEEVEGTAIVVNLDGNAYMDPVPTEDPWANDYVYDEGAPAAGEYTLTCIGPDETAGGTDDIVIITGQLQE